MTFENCPLKTYPVNYHYSGKENDIVRINELFKSYGLSVNDSVVTPQIVRYIIDLPIDVKIITKIKRESKSIETTLRVALKSNDINFNLIEDKLIIERKKDFKPVPFGNLYTRDFHLRSNGMTILLGQDMQGKTIFTDLSKAPHILIAGTTGSGKSEVIHSIIASLLMQCAYGKEGPGIAVIDMKGSEYNKYSNAYPITIYRDETTAFKVLDSLCDMMDERYKAFANALCDDIYEYRQKGHEMRSVVCIIDELADLILKNRSVESKIVRLAQKARACGIHLVIGTQTPRHTVVTGLIKANIPFKIALNTSTSLDSRIILDEAGAEKLFGMGDMLIKKGGNKAIHAQGCFVCDDDKYYIAKAAQYNDQHYEILPQCTPTSSPYTVAMPINQPQKKKHVGLIQGMINLMNVKPIMFRTDDYPPRI